MVKPKYKFPVKGEKDAAKPLFGKLPFGKAPKVPLKKAKK